jgi:hypothetical protein
MAHAVAAMQCPPLVTHSADGATATAALLPHAHSSSAAPPAAALSEWTAAVQRCFQTALARLGGGGGDLDAEHAAIIAVRLFSPRTSIASLPSARPDAHASSAAPPQDMEGMLSGALEAQAPQARGAMLSDLAAAFAAIVIPPVAAAPLLASTLPLTPVLPHAGIAASGTSSLGTKEEQRQQPRGSGGGSRGSSGIGATALAAIRQAAKAVKAAAAPAADAAAGRLGQLRPAAEVLRRSHWLFPNERLARDMRRGAAPMADANAYELLRG